MTTLRTPFNSTRWIGLSLSYPDFNTPKDVLSELHRLLQVPAYYRGLIPSHAILIEDLLSDTSFPSFDASLTDHHTFFSSSPPDIDIPFNLPTRAVPPLMITNVLLETFGQQWFNGAQSIRDPWDTTCFLPFWVLVYWNCMGCVIQGQCDWCDAHAWIMMCGGESNATSLVV